MMKLFDTIIQRAGSRLGSQAPKRYPYTPRKTWPQNDSFELVMLRDAAYELGSGGGVNYTCVTTDVQLVDRDEILVYGKDLSEIRQDSPYARIALLRIDDIPVNGDDMEPVFRAIQNIDFVKYRVFPKGFMMRTSSESCREQIRVSKKAVKGGISFEAIGNTLIDQYKKDPLVQAVKLIFVTAPDADYDALLADAKSAKEILLTLSKILSGMPKDCTSCALKPICDEVDGMRELHFGQKD